MKHEPKKLDIEAAFREAARQGEAPTTENSLLLRIGHSVEDGFLGRLLLALFSLFAALIGFAAVFQLMGHSPRSLYSAIMAAVLIGALTAPLRYQPLLRRTLPFSALPEAEPPPLPGELAEIRADTQKGTFRNRAIMRIAVFGYVLCLWFLSVTTDDRLHGVHVLLLTMVIAAPLLLLMTIWRALGPLK